MPGFIYNRSLTEQEFEVTQWENGRFAWVATSELRATEALGCHSHHSHNTHLITSGRVNFYKNCEARNLNPPLPENLPEDPDAYITVYARRDGPNRRFNVPPGLCYIGIAAGYRDAEFVEGHEVLSPRTRDRFLDRETIVWSDTEDHVGPVNEEVRRQGCVTKEDVRRNRGT